MTYNDFKTRCENLAKKYDVDVDVKYYDMSQYGHEDWFQAAFLVDHFGGIAAIVSFFEDNLKFEGYAFERIFTDWGQMEEWLAYEIHFEKEARQNVALSEMANID